MLVKALTGCHQPKREQNDKRVKQVPLKSSDFRNRGREIQAGEKSRETGMEEVRLESPGLRGEGLESEAVFAWADAAEGPGRGGPGGGAALGGRAPGSPGASLRGRMREAQMAAGWAEDERRADTVQTAP